MVLFTRSVCKNIFNFRTFGVILAVALSLSACATPPPRASENACAVFLQNREWYRAATKAERKWGVPVSLQLAIIRKESSFVHDAKPARKKILGVLPGKRPSSAKGYAQALDGTWEAYKKETGNRLARRSSFADATDFIGWYVAKSNQRSRIARDNAYHQYLAYHEGQGGYNRGTWKNKSHVKQYASKVANYAASYERQLTACDGKLQRDVPLLPFI